MELPRATLLLPLLLLIAVQPPNTLSISRDLLYPHGPEANDLQLPNEDEGSSPETELKVPIVFYDEVHTSVYVNINGLLSFLTEIPNFFNVQFPLEYPVIAALYTDVDIRGGGDVYYRETQEETLLRRASETVNYSFSKGRNFQAKSLFIATWKDVGYFDNGVDKANTFQVVIASDGSSSYAFLLYADQGVQWIQGKGKSARPDARAQAGIISGDGRMTELRGSGTDQIQNLDKWTNSDVPGQWLFFIGPTNGQHNDVSIPDLQTGHSQVGPGASCLYGATECHSKAQCVDYRPGFCCLCQDGFYGNGHNCLQDDIPLRVNGKVSGTLNGIKLEDLDLQSYIVTTDGRTYTAISRVPEELGYDMQSLNVLGTAIGWLFARPIKSSKNGYELTGGVYNHSMEVFFPNSGNRVTVRQRFLGLDVFDQLRTEIYVSGTIPAIPPDTRIEMDDYEEKLTRSEPGIMKAFFTRKYKIGGENGIETPFTVDQTMEYDECAAYPPDITTLRLKLNRNYILYEAREKIVRYAMTSKITPLGDDDPCKEEKINCGAHSTCLVEQDNAKCVCNKGYQFIYDEAGEQSAVCVDINECISGQHRCHHNALCLNEEGTYRCQCNSGFQGNGFACEKIPSCSDVRCHPDAECAELPSGIPECICNPGFRGNGLQCYPEDDTTYTEHTENVEHPNAGEGGDGCHVNHNCSPYAACKYDPHINTFACVCLPGYQGDGHSCEASHGYKGSGVPLPTCLLEVCWCPSGFRFEQQTHQCISDAPTDPSQGSHVVHGGSHGGSHGGGHGESHGSSHGGSQGGSHGGSHGRPYEGSHGGSHGRPYEGSHGGSHGRPYEGSHGGSHGRPYEGSHGGSHGGSHSSPVIPGNEEEEEEDDRNISCNVVSNCHPHAQCVFTQALQYFCKCNAGYEGDGYDCTEIEISCAEVDICHINATCIYSEHNAKYLCTCDPGFDGDGTTCYPSGDCESHSDCSTNAQCLYNHVAHRYQCNCNVGFNGDGRTCELDSESACGTCHENAQCQYHVEHNQFRCECLTGYIGDGRTRCEIQRPGCNVLNDCGAQAECVLNPNEGGYRCRCKEGFTGDGHQCRPVLTCDQDRRICHENADCVPEARQYSCRCKEGYAGDGFICRAAQSHEGQFLLVNQGMATLRIPFKPTFSNRGRPIQIQYYQIAVGIDIDCLEGRVYWGDVNGKSIKSCKYDGADRENLLAKNIEAPEGVALDWVSRNIFWTDSSLKQVEVASLDLPRRRKVLVSEGLVNPRGIAVHPGLGKLFWSDWNRESPKIEMSNMDGTGRQILVQQGLQLPNSLAIDYGRNELCWADAGTKTIECIGIHTSHHRTVVSECSYPFGLAISESHYYWTDWATKKVESAARPSGELLDALEVPLGGNGNLFGITAVPDRCPRLSNACQADDTCPDGYLCLPNGRGGRTCMCSDSGEGVLCNEL